MAQNYRPGVGNVVVSNPAGLQDVYNWLVHYYASTGQVPPWANRPWVLSILPSWVFALNAGQPLPWQVSPAANQQMSPALAEAANKLASLVTPSPQATQTQQQSTQSTTTQNTSTTIPVIHGNGGNETHNTGGQSPPKYVVLGPPRTPSPPPPQNTTPTTTSTPPPSPVIKQPIGLEGVRGTNLQNILQTLNNESSVQTTTTSTSTSTSQTTTNPTVYQPPIHTFPHVYHPLISPPPTPQTESGQTTTESRSTSNESSSAPSQPLPTPLGERRLHSPVVF
jgi:hypothetical protein